MEAKRIINSVIIHCADTPDNSFFSLSDIDRWHKERGFSGVEVEIETKQGKTKKRIYCGYHYVVKRDGAIEIGRPEWAIGAHCEGHNSKSLGVCWMGKFALSDPQRQGLYLLVKNLCLKHGLKAEHVYGHKEFNPKKTCPNLDMNLFRKTLRDLLDGGVYGDGSMGPK